MIFVLLELILIFLMLLHWCVTTEWAVWIKSKKCQLAIENGINQFTGIQIQKLFLLKILENRISADSLLAPNFVLQGCLSTNWLMPTIRRLQIIESELRMLLKFHELFKVFVNNYKTFGKSGNATHWNTSRVEWILNFIFG